MEISPKVYTLTSPKNTQNVMVQSFIKKRKRIAENHVNQHRKENVHSHRLEGGEPKESLGNRSLMFCSRSTRTFVLYCIIYTKI